MNFQDWRFGSWESSNIKQILITIVIFILVFGRSTSLGRMESEEDMAVTVVDQNFQSTEIIQCGLQLLESTSLQPLESTRMQPLEKLYLPSGFRFHPTDEELVQDYLYPKAESRPFSIQIIADVDIYKFDPWDLPAQAAVHGEAEWYFFSPRDRKYPNGSRPNRAAGSGYWKATGTDKHISCAVESSGSKRQLDKMGVKKALVFYQGRAPNGVKTNWIMHEYRLANSIKLSPPTRRRVHKKGSLESLRLDDWVLCRIYSKKGKSNNPSIVRHEVKQAQDEEEDEEEVESILEDEEKEESINLEEEKEKSIKFEMDKCWENILGADISPNLLNFEIPKLENISYSPSYSFYFENNLKSTGSNHETYETMHMSHDYVGTYG